MIQKIASGEYMKRLDNMDGAERENYLKRVGEWLKNQAPLLVPKTQDPQAEFQNAVRLSGGWNDAECQAWNDGARLLTALSGHADTWLPDMLYAKAAKRTVRQMVKVLRGINDGTAELRKSQRMTAGVAKEAVLRPTEEPAGTSAKEEPAVGTAQATQAVADIAAGKPTVTVGHPSAIGHQPSPVPVRPKHIDQYVHLLPQKTQERAATVKGLLRDMDVARENARRLMEAGEHSDKIAQWAKTATKLDEKVKAIYKELDAEWDKLVQSGRVTVDDFGNAHVVEPAAGETADSEEDEKAGDDQKEELTTAQKAQVRSLRSWLRDTRGPKEPGEKHDAYVVRWKEKFQELVKVAGKDGVTEAVVKAAGLYGINIDEIQINN